MVYTDINSTTINGRLTKDAVYKQIKDDFGEVSFTICSNTLTKKDGQWAAKPNFIMVKQKGKTLTNFAAALTKGKQVSVIGSLQQDSWESNGQKNSITYILAEKVQFMSNGTKSDNSVNNGNFSNDVSQGDFPEDIPEGDIPF